MSLAILYDPRGHTFESWSSLMVEAYAAQQLVINATEDEWKDWGARLMAVNLFEADSIPSPYAYDNWQDWAMALVNIVNNTNG